MSYLGTFYGIFTLNKLKHMKTILVILILCTAVASANTLTTQKGIELQYSVDHIWVSKNFVGWGGDCYRVRVRNEQGKVVEHFVSDQPFKKTATGWMFRLEGKDKYKEVSGNVEIGRL